MVYLFNVPPTPYKTRVSDWLQGGHKTSCFFEAFSGVINRTIYGLKNPMKTVAPIIRTRIHVRVPLVPQSIHIHWKVELKSFPTIYDTHKSINIGMPYTVGKHPNSSFQHTYRPKCEIRVPLIFGNGRPWGGRGSGSYDRNCHRWKWWQFWTAP